MVRICLCLAVLAPALVSAGSAQDEGFETLFNGKDFTGWKFFMGKADADPTKTFSVQDGAVICTGKPAGYMYTEKKYKDCTLRFDYRFKRPADLAEDAKFKGNSGYLFFVNDHKVWPYSLETQGMDRSVGDIFFIGAKDKSKNKHKVDAEARKKALKPVGEWSSYEVVVKDGTVTVSVNGTKITTVESHEWPEPGYIGFQSEGVEIHWKNIRIKAQ